MSFNLPNKKLDEVLNEIDAGVTEVTVLDKDTVQVIIELPRSQWDKQSKEAI